jgi:hypothetical protein
VKKTIASDKINPPVKKKGALVKVRVPTATKAYQ